MNLTAHLARKAYDVPGDWLVETRGDTLYIAVDGTRCPNDWRRDVEFLFTTDDCHLGFRNYATRIQAEMWASGVDVHGPRSVVFCGHSLGGAVATIMANDLRAHRKDILLVTFGSPRPGGAKFAQRFKVQHRRYTHGLDPVPHCPPAIFGFRHTAKPVILPQNKDSLLRAVRDHDMDAYLRYAP